MSGGIDEALRDVVARGETPGIQYAWVDPTGEIRSSCAGWAALEERRPMLATTALMAYSMSKVLTAEAVALLAREGQLRIDDPVARYLPGLPYGAAVSVRHLLEHRAGIPNPIPLRWVHRVAAHDAFDEAGAMEAVLRRFPRRRSEPGTRTLYSNLGYWLLGRVVEQVAGAPFVAFVGERLLRLWGIAPSEIGYAFPADGSQARGYLERFSLLRPLLPFVMDAGMLGEATGRWVRVQDHYVNGPAFGGAIGTARGFCVLARHLLEAGDSGFGWSDWPGGVQKEGGGAGFRCLLRLDRRRRRASVVMTNATGFRVAKFLDRMDALAASGAGEA